VIVKDFKNPGYQAGAIQSVKDAFGSKGAQEHWFDDYDWVMKTNPDTLLIHDKWILKTMNDNSTDAIFHDCGALALHSDFFMVRPRAVNVSAFDFFTMTKQFPTAEMHLYQAFTNIRRSMRYKWLQGAAGSLGVCRMRGPKSPVAHNHELWRYCPDYIKAWV
ncbi:unnamed protein product, partial [Symbiodinium pilosum]